MGVFVSLFVPVMALILLWPATISTARPTQLPLAENVPLRIEPGLISNRGGRPAASPPLPVMSLASINQSPVNIHLHLRGTAYTLETHGTSLREGLTQASIFPKTADFIRPSLDSPLSDGMHVYLHESLPVVFYADGEVASLFTLKTTVAEALSEAGLQLGDEDRVEPALDTRVLEPTEIRITRVSQEVLTEEETIDYPSVRRPSADMEVNTESLAQEGEYGIFKRTLRISYEDGQEIGRTVQEEWVEKEPVPRVTLYGTKIIYPTIDTPNGPLRYRQKLRLLATAYDADGGEKPRNHPAFGITYTGMRAGFGVVAVDPRVIPLYTRLYVPGYGVAIAGDTGGGIKGDRIDLGYELGQTGRWGGTRWVDVYILW